MSKYRAASSRTQASDGEIFLLIDHDQNRRLLADWLASEYDVVSPDDVVSSDDEFGIQFDLCIVDEPSFDRYRDELATRKDAAAPTFLPYLLVTSTNSPARTPEVWNRVDEIVTTPIEKAVLQARIDGLLERRRLSVELEREKETSEERFRTLFQTAPDPVFVLGAEGRIQAVNDAFCRVSGLDRAAVLDERLVDIDAFPNDSLEKLTADVRERESDGESPLYSVTYTASEGETRYAEINTARAQIGTERPEVIGIFRDVTEHKRRKRELKDQNERLDEFASMLAHELRNPLGIAQGYLQVAELENTDDAFDEVRGALGRMEKMIDEMLDLARRPGVIEDTQLATFHDIVEDVWSRVAPPEATLVLENVEGEISADVDRLSQVFENLFRNAVEHAGDDVSVHVERLPDGVYIEDDGPGISSDHRDSVFESGFTTNDGIGLGLGLSIVAQIVEAHGWEITVTEAKDGGARFEITGMEFVERAE